MRRLFIKVYSNNQDYDADCSMAVVEVTEELIALVQKRHKALVREKKNGGSLAHVAWWDYTAHYVEGYQYDQITEAYGEDAAKACENAEWVEPHSFAPLTFDFLRTECDQMQMDDTDVWWECSPKHGNITLRTSQVKVADFVDILKKHEQEMPWDKNSSGTSSKARTKSTRRRSSTQSGKRPK